MACALTQGYTLDCSDSYGGVKELHLIEFDNVSSFTESAGVVTAITKATGKAFKKYTKLPTQKKLQLFLVKMALLKLNKQSNFLLIS
jgi:hypothetical protein